MTTICKMEDDNDMQMTYRHDIWQSMSKLMYHFHSIFVSNWNSRHSVKKRKNKELEQQTTNELRCVLSSRASQVCQSNEYYTDSFVCRIESKVALRVRGQLMRCVCFTVQRGSNNIHGEIETQCNSTSSITLPAKFCLFEPFQRL